MRASPGRGAGPGGGQAGGTGASRRRITLPRAGAFRGIGMLLGVPLGELAWLAAAVVLAGVATGILAGLFGIGGGAIIVPVLYEVFRILGVPEEVRMQLCIGTSLAIIVPTAVRSYRAHKARGFALAEVMRRWALPSMVGVAVGSA